MPNVVRYDAYSRPTDLKVEKSATDDETSVTAQFDQIAPLMHGLRSLGRKPSVLIYELHSRAEDVAPWMHCRCATVVSDNIAFYAGCIFFMSQRGTGLHRQLVAIRSIDHLLADDSPDRFLVGTTGGSMSAPRRDRLLRLGALPVENLGSAEDFLLLTRLQAILGSNIEMLIFDPKSVYISSLPYFSSLFEGEGSMYYNKTVHYYKVDTSALLFWPNNRDKDFEQYFLNNRVVSSGHNFGAAFRPMRRQRRIERDHGLPGRAYRLRDRKGVEYRS